VRRVECIRGECAVDVEVFPAFNYAQDSHTTKIVDVKDSRNGECGQTVQFRSKSLSLQLCATIDCGEFSAAHCPELKWQKFTPSNTTLGEGIRTQVTLKEGQGVSFVLRDLEDDQEEHITTTSIDTVQKDTSKFWYSFINQSKYKGRWREVVNRSLMILKLLVYEPTGAIVAAPTFSLPEDFGGGRNWDYRFSWVGKAVRSAHSSRATNITALFRFATALSQSISSYVWASRKRLRPTCPSSPIVLSTHAIQRPELYL